MLHCRTVQHVAALYNVSADELRRAVRTTTPRATTQVTTRYKVVCVLDDSTYGTLYKHSTHAYLLGKTDVPEFVTIHMGANDITDSHGWPLDETVWKNNYRQRQAQPAPQPKHRPLEDRKRRHRQG